MSAELGVQFHAGDLVFTGFPKELPRRGELVRYGVITYKVMQVMHNYTENIIDIFLEEVDD